MSQLEQLESIAVELISAFDVNSAPVPIEEILQNPKGGMWQKVDITQLSGSFLSIKDRYSPRMSIARLLAKHATTCPWGEERNLFSLLREGDNLQRFARMLVMPSYLVEQIDMDSQTPMSMSSEFEVPEDDVRLRLDELSKSS